MDRILKETRNHYCDLEARATLKAQHGHIEIAELLDKWASKIARDYRGK